MTSICPNCGAESKFTRYESNEEIEIRGETISIDVAVLKCEKCGEEVYDLGEDEDALDLAYHEYRKKHSMVRPHEIRELRSRYGLTQMELSRLLGWGGATISRYENGALQDFAHDKVLLLIKDPRNLLQLLQENSSAIQGDKRERMIERLKDSIVREHGEVRACFEDLLGAYAPDEYSGFSRLNSEKIVESILFFCLGEGVLKTKLNKLLFYADFLHFKEYSISITGARYVHLTYGPILDNYEFYLATMLYEDRSLKIEERTIGEYLGEVLTAVRSPDLTKLENTELKILAAVKEYFQDHSASEISKRSHRERGYQETDEQDLISYRYADDIEVSSMEG